MESEHMLAVERLSQILDGLLSPMSANIENFLFESLITHLSAKENIFVLQQSIVREWIEKCLNQLEVDFKSMNPKIISFMLKLCGILARNDWVIIKLKEFKIISRIWKMIKLNTNQFDAPTKLATIYMLASIAQYSTINTSILKAWNIIIDYCYSEHVRVVHEARQLLYQLLYNFSVNIKDEEILIEMLGEIVKPLLNISFKPENGIIEIHFEDNEDQRKIFKTLDLISYIFQKTLESKEKTNIVDICTKRYNIEINIWKIFKISHDTESVEKVLTAVSSHNFAMLLYSNWDTNQIPPENFNDFGLIFFNQVKLLFTRVDCFNCLKLVRMYHVLWKRLGQRVPKVIEIEKERVCFENQLITLHMLPLFYLLQSKEIIKLQTFDDFIQQIFESSCPQTQRLSYEFRDVISYIKEGSTTYVFDLAYKSVHSILSLENKLEREHAVLVIKAMIYPLQDLIVHTSDHATSCNTRKYSKEQAHTIFCTVLVALRTLIERYHISWKESIETIGLVNCVGRLLENSDLPTRLTVEGLKLIQLSIEHFLSPNMALLVNSLQGSGMDRLGPMIIKRVHDDAWDVRDSVVELVASIAEISRKKFPVFQQFLVNHNICTVIYDRAKQDPEPYVRASAFKCLTNFVLINSIWDNKLKSLDIIEHIFHVLYNESEASVRREAVNTLSKIYDYRKIPPQLLNTFYSTLAHCTIMDLHWEVKVNALNFWKLEIQRQFTYQGMIDGSFPTVTFSKESRKIVTLTEKEINVRIIKALNELSHRGCLDIILKCLTEECDRAVIKAAINVVVDLLKLLDKYNYESALDDIFDCVMSSELDLIGTPIYNDFIDLEELPVKTSVCSCSESVINEILNTHTIDLLTNCCKTQFNINEKHQQIDEELYKQFTNTSIKKFITIVKNMDFEELLHKNAWHPTEQNFISLMDDIIILLKPNSTESIFTDCY